MKEVKIQLSAESVDNALKELENFQKWIEEGTKKLVQLLGEKGRDVAQQNYSEALYTGNNDVTVTVEAISDTKVAVSASGHQVLFMEFGTGIKNPEGDNPLSSMYPHGEYGKGYGSLPDGWTYPQQFGAGNAELAWPDPNHEGYLRTYGQPASSSLYHAELEVEDEYLNLVKEAFGKYA